MSLNFVASLNLNEIIPELDKALKLLALFGAQLDLALFGSLSLGSLQASLAAQLQASIQASLDIGLSISNPFIGFQLALAGAAALLVQIQAALAGALPVIGLNVAGQLNAQAALIVELKIKLGLINALIQVMLGLKAQILIPNLAVGPIGLYSFQPLNGGGPPATPTPNLASVGAAIAAEFASPGNLMGVSPLLPAYGIVLATTVAPAWVLIQKIFRTV